MRRVFEIEAAAVKQLDDQFVLIDGTALEAILPPPSREPLTIEDERMIIAEMFRASTERFRHSDYAGDFPSYLQGFMTALLMARKIDHFRNQDLLDAVTARS
jgi:hypothetical protein